MLDLSLLSLSEELTTAVERIFKSACHGDVTLPYFSCLEEYYGTLGLCGVELPSTSDYIDREALVGLC